MKGRTLQVTLLISLVAFAGCVRSTPKTIALWLFDDPQGSRVAVDSSGNGYHLTLGLDADIVPGGKFVNALDPDALDTDALGAYRYKAEPQLNPGDADWTLECWLKAKPTMRADNRIWGLSGVNYIDYGRGDHLTSLQVASRFLPIDGPGGWNKPSGDLKADEEYHHVAVVYDSSAKELRHYFDGHLEFAAPGVWKAVEAGEPPYADTVFPPHYPTLHIGMRDAIQQWDHHELHAERGEMKKFGGFIDEMRFSRAALYTEEFTPPGSLARPFLRVWPQRLSFVAIGERDPPPQTVAVSSVLLSGAWSTREDIPWLSIHCPPKANQGGPDSTARVTVDTSALPVGRYTGRIKFRAPGAVDDPVTVHVCLAVVEENDILDVGDRKQLFIDGRFIESSENVALRVNRPEKLDITFEAAADVPLYPSNIVYDEEAGVWRMYYGAFNGRQLRCAESADGIHWKRPRGGRHPVVFGSDDATTPRPLAFGAAVMHDPVDIPQRRYKAFEERRSDGQPELNGVYAYYSADGFHFTESGRVMSLLPETPLMTAMWDARIEKYVVYMRVMNSRKGLRMIQGNQFFYRPGFTYAAPEGRIDVIEPEAMFREGYENIRSIGRIETEDLLEPWPTIENGPHTIYTTPSHIPMVFAADKWDGFADCYTGPVMIYPYAQDVYLMFPTVFRHFHPSRQPWFYRFDDANGPIETQLAVSRDGVHWARPDRSPYVPMGRSDQWDRWLNMFGVGMIRVGNDLYQYYWGTGRLHDSVFLRPEMAAQPPHNPSGTGLGAVRQRLDGFVAAEVDYRGGSITTPPVVFSGNRLQLNHDSGGTGTIFVEVRDLNDLPLGGYSLADCEEITGNDVAWEVRWRGNGDVSPLIGKPVKLHFLLRATKLYAFQFVKDS
ncbi:MAG TPA: hypothetical protein HPP83_03335 [Candidatus Hydrogenedentes bacterium]|nr:hypothetical protein [Candidatus Hydrogenedentota bacterium]